MGTLDIRTISLTIGVIGILETLALFVTARLVRRYPSIHWWALGRGMNAAGALLIALGPLIPEAPRAFLAATFIVLALLPTLYGVNRFTGHQWRGQELAAAAVGIATVAGLAVFTWLAPSRATATFVSMVGAGALNLMCAWSLAHPAAPAVRRSSRAAALIAGTYGVWLLARGALVLIDLVLSPALDLTPIHTMTLVGMISAVGLWTIGMIAMIVQRLLFELQHAQDSERATLRRAADELAQAFQLSQEREELFRLTFDQSPLGAAIAEADGRLVRVNAALCRISGRAAEALVGQHIGELIHGDDRAALAESACALLAQEIESFSRELRIIAPTEAAVWVKVSARLVRSAADGPARILLLADDISERRRAEERLRVIEHQQQLTLRTIPVQFWIKDLEGRYLIASDRLCAFHGYGPGELVGKTPEDVYSPELAAYIRAGDAEVLRDGAREYPETLLTSHSGTQRWIDSARAPVYDESGTLIGIIGVARDVTERHEAEEALRERETMLRAIGDNLPNAMVYQLVRTPDGQERFTYVSAGVRQVGGLTPEHVYANPGALDALHEPGHRDHYQALVARSQETLRVFEYEFAKRLPDGQRRWSYVRSRPRRLPDGSTVWDGVELDITSRKQTEQQLRRRIDELVALNQIAQALTGWTDLPTRLGTVGRLLRDLFGASAVSIWEQRPAGQIYELMRVCGETALATERRIEVASSPLTQRVLARDAGLIDWANDDLLLRGDLAAGEPPRGVLLVPLHAHGAATGLLAITPESAGQVYTPADQALAQTVAGALAAAIENARLFDQAQHLAVERERRRIAQDLHDSVNQALLAAARTAELVPQIWELDPEEGYDALLDLRRLTSSALDEMRALVVELYPRTLTDTPLHESLRHLAPAAAAKAGAVLDTQLSPTPLLPPNVQVAMYRIAQEALNNAYRHAHAARLAIALTVAPPANGAQWSGEISIRVSDDGCGFDTERSAPSNIGLASMRERAADIGAALAIQSQPGRGTTVTATWRGRAAQKETHQP